MEESMKKEITMQNNFMTSINNRFIPSTFSPNKTTIFCHKINLLFYLLKGTPLQIPSLSNTHSPARSTENKAGAI